MILAVSRFRSEGGGQRPAEILPDRSLLMSQISGFLGTETFRCATDASRILLMTRWEDETSFQSWLSSSLAPSGLLSSSGLEVDPELPEPVVLARIEEQVLDHEVADAGLLLTRFLVEAQSLYFLRADPQGMIVSCNGSWSELLGIPAAELPGRPIWGHLTDRDADQLRYRVRDLLRRPQDRFLLNVCDAQGRPHTLECHLDVRPNGFILLGEPTYAAARRLEEELGALNRELALLARERARAQARAEAAERERSELLEREREARREAEQANRIKDDFLGMVSHELRNPLSAILYWAELLAAGTPDEAMARHAVKVILRNTSAQIRLVEDLLDVTRIASGTLRTNPRPIDPAAVVDAAVEAVRPTAEGKGITLVKSSEGGPAVLAADPARLEQALVNLLGNAVKFTLEQGRVEVRLEISDAEVCFQVSDTGPGLAPGLLATLFEPFRQGSHGGRSSGLGLGLTIARNIVQLHGGDIEAASPGPGQGAVFTIRLPRPV